MISFRVSEVEFQALTVKAEHYGARSLSDFARLVLYGAGPGLSSLPSPPAGGASDDPSAGGPGDRAQVVSQLSDQIHELRAHIRHVEELLETQLIASTTGTPAPRSAANAAVNGGAANAAASSCATST